MRTHQINRFDEYKPPRSDLNGRPPVLRPAVRLRQQTGALTELSYRGKYVHKHAYEQRERQDLNLQPSAPQADALSNCATLPGGKQWTRTTGFNPHLFSNQRLLPDRIAFHEMDKREKTYPMGQVRVELTMLKNSGHLNNRTDLYLRR